MPYHIDLYDSEHSICFVDCMKERGWAKCIAETRKLIVGGKRIRDHYTVSFLIDIDRSFSDNIVLRCLTCLKSNTYFLQEREGLEDKANNLQFSALHLASVYTQSLFLSSSFSSFCW